jgi:serine/threonine protein phosphatase PrpC
MSRPSPGPTPHSRHRNYPKKAVPSARTVDAWAEDTFGYTPTPAPQEVQDGESPPPGSLAWLTDPELFRELATCAERFDDLKPHGSGPSFPLFCLQRFAPYPLHRLTRDQLLLFVDNLWTHLMPEVPWSWSQLFLSQLSGETTVSARWFLDRLVDCARRDTRLVRPQGSLRWELGYGRERGCHKRTQEDLVFGRNRGRAWFCLVCDGVSRATIGTGEEASALVEQTLTARLPELDAALDRLGGDLPEPDWRALAEDTLGRLGHWINEDLIREIRRRHPGPIQPEEHVMSVAATMVILRDTWGVIAQCGDSGAFLLRDGQMMPVTREHSVRFSNILSRLSGRTQVAGTRDGVINLLPNAAGTERVQVLIPAIGELFTFTHLHLDNKCRLLVCTDGLIPRSLARRVMLAQIVRRVPPELSAAQGAAWILQQATALDCEDDRGLCWLIPV